MPLSNKLWLKKIKFVLKIWFTKFIPVVQTLKKLITHYGHSNLDAQEVDLTIKDMDITKEETMETEKK